MMCKSQSRQVYNVSGVLEEAIERLGVIKGFREF